MDYFVKMRTVTNTQIILVAIYMLFRLVKGTLEWIKKVLFKIW